MKIETGTPTQGGRYACYLPGVGLPTVVRLFIPGHGWCDNLHEKISGDVAGWIGPLPTWPENSVQSMSNARRSQTIQQLEAAGRVNSEMDYDL